MNHRERRSQRDRQSRHCPPHRFIVVEGPIGVGKTSLARRLARSFGSELVLEQADENPFLERFYRNPRAAALQTQLFFLFQRTRQLEDIRQHDLFETVRVADYLLDKDRLFAQLTLDEEELALYEQVYARLAVDAPAPDLVIYLQAPVDVLLERIERRGIRYEQQIERRVPGEAAGGVRAVLPRLRRLAAADRERGAGRTSSSNEGDYNQLLEQIRRIRRGRQYYNPLKSAV